MGTPSNVKVGPGIIYIAPVGSTEPTDLITAWDAAWVELGYTEAGHRFAYTPAYEPIDVAEELDPIRYESTGRQLSVGFSMAEMTARNLQIAFNGGTITPSGVAPNEIVTFEPPDLGAETRVAIGWESDDGNERWVYRKCLQTGTSEMARAKSPAKTVIAADFRLEVVSGTKPFLAILKVG